MIYNLFYFCVTLLIGCWLHIQSVSVTLIHRGVADMFAAEGMDEELVKKTLFRIFSAGW